MYWNCAVFDNEETTNTLSLIQIAHVSSLQGPATEGPAVCATIFNLFWNFVEMLLHGLAVNMLLY